MPEVYQLFDKWSMNVLDYCNECIQSDYNLMFTFSRANGRHFLMSCEMIAQEAEKATWLKEPEISLCVFVTLGEASTCTCSITTIMRLCRQAARFTRPLNTFKPIMREYSSPSRIATLSLASIQTFKIWVYAEFWLACLRTLTSKTSSQASRPLVFGLQTWPG